MYNEAWKFSFKIEEWLYPSLSQSTNYSNDILLKNTEEAAGMWHGRLSCCLQHTSIPYHSVGSSTSCYNSNPAPC